MTSAIQASIETIRRRVDAFGTTEPSIQREGRNRVLVQVPGIQDVERLKTLIGETGKLEFKLVDPAVDAVQAATTKQVPVGDELVYSTDNPPIPYVLKDQVLVSGQNLVDAQPGFDSRTGEPVVTFRFDAAGAKRFGKVTQENVGPALRHRARQQGDLRAGDPRADPRRHRSDQRQFHRAAGQRSCRAAQVRRAAGQAHRHRGADGRREPRRRFDRVGQEGRDHGARCSS